MTYKSRNMRKTGGYTLIEVLIGILIFAVGMMALAQLQGSLAQNSGDANARTVAINVGEELMETVRSFAQITSGGGAQAYNDIVDGSSTVTRAGYTYSIVTDVTDYYYDPDSKTFVDSKPAGSSAANSDFKHIELTVAWEEAGGREFRIDDDTTSGMGSGSITITDVISSITSPASGKVLLGTGGEDTMYAPPVDYSPGQNPDIVSINLGQNKFKESTTPLPDVIRADELVETRFDVVTYSNPTTGGGATFLRREEFRAVSCECTLRVPSTGDQGGLRPTVWTGSDYTEGEFVSKPYGESVNTQQSDFCDICCRDHHDGGTGSMDVVDDPGRSQYGPFRSSSTDYNTTGSSRGDHKHYNRDNSGNLVLAENDGDIYVEACRLVRKDGFFRVAQDLRQEGLNSFPADYLDESGEIDVYSTYVTAAVAGFESSTRSTDPYENSPPGMMTPGELGVTFPASSFSNPSLMSSSNGVEEQQLRARGIYIDYMNDELRAKIACLDTPTDGDTCDVPEASSALEIIPFYDVQLTWLSRWTESPNNYPVDVTNQAISDHNDHSRGLAKLTGGNLLSTVYSRVHKGNLGLTATDPVDLNFASDIASYRLYVRNGDSGDSPSTSLVRVSGTITSSVGGVSAADVELEGITGALCDRTLTGYECVLEQGVSKPEILVSNFFKKNKILLTCNDSGELTTHGNEHSGEFPDQNWTKYYLPTDLTTATANIVIREGSC